VERLEAVRLELEELERANGCIEGIPDTPSPAPVARGNLLLVITAARELNRITLSDSLRSCSRSQTKSQSASNGRRHGGTLGWSFEAGDLAISEAHAALAALALLCGPGRRKALELLDDPLARRHGSRLTFDTTSTLSSRPSHRGPARGPLARASIEAAARPAVLPGRLGVPHVSVWEMPAASLGRT
jgi:hypothetical protein